MPRKIVYEGVTAQCSPLPAQPNAPEGGKVLTFIDPVTQDHHNFPLPQQLVEEIKAMLSGIQPVSPAQGAAILGGPPK